MNNQYGLDSDYFIRLCAREFNPDVIRNQNPEDLARAFARAARTACAEVLGEAEFSGLPKTVDLPSGEAYIGWMTDAERAAIAEQPGTVRVPVETLRRIHRDLDACQKVIWLAGCRPRGYGFDPAYVSDAQERLKEIDALLAGGEA